MPLPKVIIQGPPLTPTPYGILSAAVVLDQTDPHTAAGVQWLPDYCGPARTTLAACVTSAGLINVSVNTARHATLAGDTPPPGTYDIDWGDGHTDAAVAAASVLGTSRTYTGDGSFTVTITPVSNLSRFDSNPAAITVTNGDASGPFALAFDYVDAKTGDDRADYVESVPFTLYHLSVCRLPGTQDREAYATRGLALGEGRGIEEGLAAVQADAGTDVVVLNSGTGDSAVVALARLEAYAAANYGGVATIHMSRAVASILLMNYALDPKGDKMYTRLGNLVIAGASDQYPGTPDGGTTDAGEAWMYASGTVVVTRNPVNTTPAVISTGGLIDNEYSVLAERTVSVGWECFLAAHKVDALDAGGASSGGVDGGTP